MIDSVRASQQVIRFIVVSGLNTFFGYSLYAFFIFMGMGYPLALLFATLLGVLFNFKTTGKFVFNNTNNQAFFKFVLVYGFIYFFQTVVIRLMQFEISNLYIAGFLTMIPAAMIAFILNKLIVFRKVYETN